jgi:hypothetical protein
LCNNWYELLTTNLTVDSLWNAFLCKLESMIYKHICNKTIANNLQAKRYRPRYPAGIKQALICFIQQESCGFKTSGERTQVYQLVDEQHDNVCLAGTGEFPLAGRLYLCAVACVHCVVRIERYRITVRATNLILFEAICSVHRIVFE